MGVFFNHEYQSMVRKRNVSNSECFKGLWPMCVCVCVCRGVYMCVWSEPVGSSFQRNWWHWIRAGAVKVKRA